MPNSSPPLPPEADTGSTPVRWPRLRRRYQRFRGWLGRRIPGPETRRGIARATAMLALLVGALISFNLQPGFGPVLDLVVGGLFGLLFGILIILGARLALKLLGALLAVVGPTGVGALGLLIFLGTAMGLPVALAVGVGVALFTAAAVLGGVASLWRRGELMKPPRAGLRGALLGLAALAAAGLLVFLVFWLMSPGDEEHLVTLAEVEEELPLPGWPLSPLQVEDPSRPGPFPVTTLTYGSGTDRRREEFASGATLTTEPVDASPFVKGNEGWRIRLRDRFWGFGFDEVPLNGRVWAPEGEGPFPLVLIVHGNHNMADYSDPGYAYLGELLASRGFVFVSVDENFFNGGFSGGLEAENDARGWLLLEHLAMWREWNRTPGNPFEGRVNLDRVALVGHSRGGEAAAIAGAFNHLSHYPDDATVDFDFGFGIRSIVAIAPSDGQYRPTGQRTPLDGVCYLTLQGGHDADVSSFSGARQWGRVDLRGRTEEDEATPYRFKASLFAYRANHGQFNSVWGRTDFSWPRNLVLNLRPLLPGDEQRRISAVMISAFLEATLHEEWAYAELFRDPRRGGDWLPEDFYISRFEDVDFEPLAGFEEDIDPSTGSRPGVRLEGQGLAQWSEEDLAFRNGGTKDNQVVRLGWRREEEAGQASGPAPSFRMTLSANPGRAASLIFSMADTGSDPPEDDEEDPADGEAKGDDDREDEAVRLLDLSLAVVDRAGAEARLPLSHFRSLLPPLPARFTKLPDESERYGKAWEPALQTFELPLEAFVAVNPDLDLERLAEVRWIFDRSPEGVILLDDIGLSVEDAPPAEMGSQPREDEGG